MFTTRGRDIAIEAARHSQLLRARGVQVGTFDSLIATFCIVSGMRLLTSDRHLQPFADMLGLSLIHPSLRLLNGTPELWRLAKKGMIYPAPNV